MDRDEHCFATDEVLYSGQLIGLIIAEDAEIGRKAALKVKINYKDNEEPLITIEVRFTIS